MNFFVFLTFVFVVQCEEQKRLFFVAKTKTYKKYAEISLSTNPRISLSPPPQFIPSTAVVTLQPTYASTMP